MGISVRRVFAISWCIATVVSSIGGILVGNIGGVGVELSYIGLKVLPAVIFGGLDSVLGAIIGGLVVGVLEFLSAGYLDPYIPAINEVFPFIVEDLPGMSMTGVLFVLANLHMKNNGWPIGGSLEFSRASGLTAVLADDLRVTFGDAQGYEFKVAALFPVLQRAEEEGRTPRRVDLRFGDRVAIQ